MEFALDRYEVQPGDTVQSIALQSGIPVDKLRRWNKLFGNEVYASQIILVRDPNPSPRPAPSSADQTGGAPAASAESPPFIDFSDETPEDLSAIAPPPAPTDATAPSSSSRRADVEALGGWVQAISNSVGSTISASMSGLTVRGPTPPPPHDPSVLSDIIIEKDPDSINLKSTEDIEDIISPAAGPDAPIVPLKRAPFSSTRKLEGKGAVLTPERSELLREALPIFLQDETLTLLYSVLTHGSDTASFFSHTEGYQYSLIVIQASSGEIFGGFAACSWKQSSKYYGEGQSFVFQLVDDSAVVPYHWTQNNDFFMWSDASSVAMGGGGNGFAFIVSDDFHHGNTNRSGTFENCAFVKNNSFDVDSVEVWGFKKYTDRKKNSSARRR